MRNKKQSWGVRLAGILAVSLGLQCHDAQQTATAAERDAAPSDYVVATTATPTVPDSVLLTTPMPIVAAPDEIAALVESDPVAFVRHCRESYLRRGVSDYTCRFTKQEFVNRKLGAVEEAVVRFREEPYSVDMEWTKNPPAVNRALYVKNAWVDHKGSELAWFRPKGAILKLFVPKIKQPIRGKRAKKAARRSLDQFGFLSTLDLIIEFTELAQERNESVRIHYVGERSIDGRPTWTFERHLPYTGTEVPYPDALLRYHIDQEWLVPTGCYSYADHDGTKLLGSYVIHDVQFNVGLTGDDFDPKKLGF